jgi:hypothetical protein
MNGTTINPDIQGADGFCYVGGNRTYSTQRCIAEYSAHRGQDFAPLTPSSVQGSGSWGPHGTTPILASAYGQVTESGCINGNGYTITVRDSTNHNYRHLHPSAPPLVAQWSYVSPGQRLGYVGGTRDAPCTSIYYTVPHLHYEIRWPNMDSYADAMDPWKSSRTSYARPGLWSSGTVDTLMRDAWIYFAAAYGLGEIGYSVSKGPSWGPNVNWENKTSDPNSLAGVQYLTSGLSNYDVYKRSGALVHVLGVGPAYIVRGLWWKEWSGKGRQNSFLGWPTSFDSAGRQNFQGGCIVVSGTTVTSKPYGTSPCV